MLFRSGAFSFVHNNQFYLCHGDAAFLPEKLQCTNDQLLPLQRFDFSSAQWSGVSPVCVDHEPKARDFWTVLTGDHDHGVGCALLGNCAYIHGGCWEYGYAVHELNVETMVCRRLEPKNGEDGPKHKNNLPYCARMVACGDEALCVISTTNKNNGMNLFFHLQLHMFHVPTG